ncbi:LOW QUALITY PROTEIN: rho GTPase-activating protein 23-like [Lampris incognitus]|uniref:LOW QUALITY PROTEIN: rho GTPase-activating protein 23-like n=1 Tax=Lampris incognitus TaxID=2546036 RepID=UPI0024B4EAE0|nr:LOW QUALITY PROTEIN: rho GTPase-activating protein 23-like [Lampris incognitus]
MLNVSDVAPAPSGHEWHFQCSVGVDCSDAEPRCIWLAVLRGVSPRASPLPTPIASPRRRCSRRLVRRHRLSWAKGRRDGLVSTNENRRRPLSSGEVEGMSWQGPRTLLLQKNSQGFGFTLRHFIVYPPESSLHINLKDEENGNATGKGCQRSRLEPMDTIFVKSVRDNGPAQQAGLCTGDRLVKVNGESVLGKTYSQVIALIQNSENILELSIMPKDEDVLQLVSAYSQDAYLKGNEPYTGGAQDLPEPPPLCYPYTKPSPTASQNQQSPLDNRHCWPSPALNTSQLDNRSTGATVTQTSGWPGGPEDADSHYGPLGRHRGRSSSSISTLDFHFANHNAAIASATLPPPRKNSLPVSSRAHTDALCHQALSDWYYSQAEAAERMSPRHRSISQDRLVELGLGLALGPGPAAASGNATDRRKRETLLFHHRAAAASHDSRWLGGWGSLSGPESRSCSESLLAAYAEYEHTYGRSVETLAQASALVSPRYDHSLQGCQKVKGSERKDQKPAGGQQYQTTATSPVTTSSSTPPTGRQPGQQVAEPQTRRVKEEELVGYKSYSPSFCRKADHILQQAHSFREPNYSGPQLNWNLSSKGGSSDSEGAMVPRPQSTPALPTSEEERARLGEGREVLSHPPLNHEVVLRQKPPSGRRTPTHVVRHPQYGAPEPPTWLPSPGTPSPVSGGSSLSRRANGSLAQHTQDSLSSIPFIDEPTSPCVDSWARHMPACTVASTSSVQSSPVVDFTSTAVSPTLSSTSPFVKLRSQDCSSIKARRSSYLLAITTERSKSCDEGLNTFREEGRVFSRLPKRVKSFFTDGSLESLRAQEEARTKRHSTSELGTITFSDVRKEGWLHYKQILTEKGKKVGGGMRPWKRVFSVLRSHSLFLYKDKREAVLHGAGAGTSQEEHPPISIRGCLIDIAYSETKRKHTLRLTTQDFCEYLLQTEDRDDMLAWIKVIRENSKTDNEELGFSRQALINKKLNDYRKQSPMGNKLDTSPRAHRMMPPFLLAKTDNASINRSSKTDDIKALWGINIMKKAKKTGSPKAFDIRLEDCQPALNNKFVPLIVEMCCGIVEASGLEYTGIYRVPGNNAMVSNLQEHLNKGMDINTAEERWQDLNVISSLLKSFFRKLPEPLFTDEKYGDFIEANRIEDTRDRLKTMKKLIHDLPDHYHHTLKFLVGHLKKVADNSEKNKMEPRNLALVFGPTLVRTSEDNMNDMVTHMPDRYKIVETLILHHDWFFGDGELDKDDKAPEDKQDGQPVPNIDHLLSNIGRTGIRPTDASDSTTSDSSKSKLSPSSKGELNAKDFLPMSIISAVTRKRKKCLSTYLTGSSADEDSDHEPVKASNYGGGGGEEDGRKEEKKNGEEEVVKRGHAPLERERGDEDLKGMEATESTGEKASSPDREEVEKEDRTCNERWDNRKGLERANRQGERMTSPRVAPNSRPNSFLYSHHQLPENIQASYLRHPIGASHTQHLRPHNQAKAHPINPSWFSPTRFPNLSQNSSLCGTQHPDFNQPVPLRYRKTREGRVRAMSMNLDHELGKNEDRVRGRMGEKVEVIRVIEGVPTHYSHFGVPQGSVVGPVSIQRRSWLDPLPHLALEAPSLSSPSSEWTDQGSPDSSTVVLRRSALDVRDKRRAWRRHTVVV